MSQWNGADALNTHMSAISYSTEAQGEGQTDGKIKRSTAGTVCSFFFLAICAAVSVAIGWHFRVKSFEDKEIAKHQFDGRIVRRFNSRFGMHTGLETDDLTGCNRLKSQRI